MAPPHTAHNTVGTGADPARSLLASKLCSSKLAGWDCSIMVPVYRSCHALDLLPPPCVPSLHIRRRCMCCCCCCGNWLLNGAEAQCGLLAPSLRGRLPTLVGGSCIISFSRLPTERVCCTRGSQGACDRMLPHCAPSPPLFIPLYGSFLLLARYY